MKGGVFVENEFIDFMKNKRLSENTYNSYANDIKIFKIYYEDSYGEPLVKLVHADIAMYSNYLKKNNATPKTINRKMAALKKYNMFLVEKGIQDNIVILDNDFIKIQKSIINKPIPSIQEVNKLKHFASLDEKNAKRDYACVVLFLYGGLRESELVNLRIIDIHLDERLINVIGKGNKFRQVIINNDMFDAIRDYLEERNAMDIGSIYLFVGQKTMGESH